MVDHPGVGDRREDLVAELHDRVDAAAALRHAVHLGELDVQPGRRRHLGKQVGGEDGALAADTAQHDRGDDLAHRIGLLEVARGPGVTIASYLQTCTHWPHPTQTATSM